MLCPLCGSKTTVSVTYKSPDHVQRYRKCTKCMCRFRTEEVRLDYTDLPSRCITHKGITAKQNKKNHKIALFVKNRIVTTVDYYKQATDAELREIVDYYASRLLETQGG